MRAFSRSRPLTGSAWRCASAALRRAVRLSPSARGSMRRSSSSARSGSGPPERRARSRLRAALPRPPRARSERDIVVEVVAFPAAPAGGLLGKGRGAAAGPAAGRALGGAAHGSRPRPAAATAEHLQIVADDLGRIALVSLLILPLARAQAPLDVDLSPCAGTRPRSPRAARRAPRDATRCAPAARRSACRASFRWSPRAGSRLWFRSEEHTSELQSQSNLVCRLLLEKKNCDGGVTGTT